MLLKDRTQGGLQLAHALRHFKERRPVVLALPRGGVPVGYEVAKALEAPLDLILVRKIGAPSQPELAMGAVVDGERMDIVLNPDVVASLGVSEEDIQRLAQREVQEIERRRKAYLGDRAPVPVAGRTAIVVDDGIATGATVRAALRALRRREPEHLVLAVPVAPPDTVALLRPEVDEVVCIAQPSPFYAIGQFYVDFRQVDDDEVRDLLERAEALGGERAGRASP